MTMQIAAWAGLSVLGCALVYLQWVHVSRRLTTVHRGRAYQAAAMRPSQLLRVVRRLSIDTVIDFRGGSEMPAVLIEKAALEKAGVRHTHIPCGAVPSPGDIGRFVAVIRSEHGAGRRVLLHCKDGEGRAVAFAAVYRMEVLGWSPLAAYRATTRLPLALRFINWFLPFAGRLSPSNPKSRLILAYEPSGRALQPPTASSDAAVKAGKQRLLDHYVGVPLCALLSLIATLRGRRGPVVQPRRVLVILLSEMGSMVCTQPMFHELAQRYPAAEIYLLVLARNREVVDLLQLVPPECIFAVPDDSLFDFLVGALSAIRRLRRLRLDVVIDCELFARISAIFAFLSAAKLHVGFHRHTLEGLYRGSFIDRPVLYNAYAHIATQFLSLGAAIESTTTPPGKESPLRTRPVLKQVSFSDRDRAGASERLYKDFPSLQGHPLALIYAGSGPLPVRAWPIEYFIQLARAFIANRCAVAVIGLPADKPLGTAIVRGCNSVRCVDLTCYTAALRDLLLIFHVADLLVTNDGGPNHFAALTPLPIVSLFGPETPMLYAPLAERAVTLYRQLPCSPCLSAYNHRRTPCDGDNQCLRQISVSEALRASQRLMAVPVMA